MMEGINVFRNRAVKLFWDVISAVIFALLIILIVVFSNVSTTPFIYNKF